MPSCLRVRQGANTCFDVRQRLGFDAVVESVHDFCGAVIDVGTNSVKLLVANVVDGRVEPLAEISEQTRLGAGFYQARHLQADRIAATAQVVAGFAAEARRYGAQRIRLIATSAAREAGNASELEGALEAISGLPLEIISGEQEAEWGFAGVRSHPQLAHRELFVLDVGGGSTEVMIGGGISTADVPLRFRRSVRLGSVRLLEHYGLAEAPTPADLARVRRDLAEFVGREIRAVLEAEAAMWDRPWAVGIGGTTAILALIHHACPTFDRALIEQTEFSSSELSHWVDRLWSMDLSQRRQLPGLPPERADVVLFGAAIYEAFLLEFRLPVLRISLRGLRYAALVSCPPTRVPCETDCSSS